MNTSNNGSGSMHVLTDPQRPQRKEYRGYLQYLHASMCYDMSARPLLFASLLIMDVATLAVGMPLVFFLIIPALYYLDRSFNIFPYRGRTEWSAHQEKRFLVACASWPRKSQG